MLMPRFFFKDEFTKFEQFFLENGAVERTIPKGTWLMRATSPNRMSYYIKEGIAEYAAINDNGDKIIYFYMGPGSLYPIPAYIDYFSLEPFLRFSAGTDMTVLEFPSSYIVSMLKQNADFSIAIVDHYSRYGNLLLSRLYINTYENMEQRIYSFLSLYVHNKPEQDMTITMSQDQLSSITSVSKPQVARIIKKLKDESIISVKRRAITIEDPVRLYEKCNEMVKLSMDAKNAKKIKALKKTVSR